jgi:dimethylamine monooxygenase subunit A
VNTPTKDFPYAATFDLKMGTSLLDVNAPQFLVDEDYHEEIKLKSTLLRQDHAYYFKSLPESKVAQWEVVSQLMGQLVHHYPTHFFLEKVNESWSWRNKLLDNTAAFHFGEDMSLPDEPLDWVGRQVQEDLVILNEGGYLIAGQLCFPSGWSLEDKFGKHFLEIHAPLPGLMNTMIQNAHKMIERIPVGKPVTRNNWGIRIGRQLDLSTKHSTAYKDLLLKIAPTLTEDTTGKQLFLRIEHQTLSRLPESKCILFTIRTFHESLENLTSSPSRSAAILHYLETVPDEVLDYKLITPFRGALTAYLNKRAGRKEPISSAR